MAVHPIDPAAAAAVVTAIDIPGQRHRRSVLGYVIVQFTVK